MSKAAGGGAPGRRDLWSLLDDTAIAIFLGSVLVILVGIGLAVATESDWFLLLGVPALLQAVAGNVQTARSNRAALVRWYRRHR